MTHLPDTAPTDGRPGPGNRGGSGDRKGGLRIAGVTVRFTIGGYLLAVLAAAVGAMILPAAAPGLAAGAYLAATAGLVALLLARSSLRTRAVSPLRTAARRPAPDEPLNDLLARLPVRPGVPAALHTSGHALVLDTDGALTGVLTPADFARASQLGALHLGRPAR